MSLEFLETLETRVREAAEKIEELASENAQLRKEVEKLERDRAAMSSGAGAKADKSVEKIEKAWAKERDEIRKRVEPLVDRLSKLLEESPVA